MSEHPRTGARDNCGVFAVYARDEDVAKLCFYGLYALQHRGQESAGIAVSDGRNILVSKEMGLVSQVFNEARLAGMDGHLGIGHVRYSTTGASTWDNAQPAFKVTPSGSGLALAHNGNLVNTAELARGLAVAGGEECTTDSEVLATLLAGNGKVGTEEALAATCRAVRGAFSLVVMDESSIYAARDAHGVRPLVIGRLPRGGYVIASETAALDIVGAHLLREVEPGEIVSAGPGGLRSRRFAEPIPSGCLFEYVYVARPDHRFAETTVYAARRRMGALLAAEAPVDADLVIPVPDSGTAAASGYAQASGIPYAEGLTKNRYVGRTFIQPTQSLRQLGIRLKLNPLPDVLKDRRLVVVDDSIVRGNTSRQLVAMLREAAAAEVHLRITAPPIRNPCFYGIDMATRAELIGSGLSVDEIRDFVGADSLAYLSLDALVTTTRRPKNSLCRACFDGDYPIPVPGEQVAGGKDVLVPAARGAR
ncbi:MAG: amidophosphoribosyltransferase [Euzebyales bacterium]|nr:amidophosphoribosyltransferase [Euzebyales bacterium]MBA3622306.1 amidophosphoribosyltransferase [Euzebyales bacterium]